MTFTYHIQHEVITRGVTTITSDSPLTPEEIRERFKDGDSLPEGSVFISDPYTSVYPIFYGDVLAINGDINTLPEH